MRYSVKLINDKWVIKDTLLGEILPYSFHERWEAEEWAGEMNRNYENDKNN